MADKSSIEWLRGADGIQGATWNPITGCSVISAGCKNCYAMKLAGSKLPIQTKFVRRATV